MKTMYSSIQQSFDIEFLMELDKFMAAVQNKLEIVAKRDELYELRRETKDPGICALLRRAIHHMDAELLTRADLFHAKERQSLRSVG